MPKDFDFRPDVSRGVFLSGEVSESSVSALIPKILSIVGDGPITLYIDSVGGHPGYATLLRRALAAPEQGSAAQRRLITVATGLAASAAADLLVAGDYTLAYEHSMILMHGVRQTPANAITRESAAAMMRNLATSNEQFALTLAGNCVGTFFFRVVAAFTSFDEIRKRPGSEHWDDVACYLETLRPRLSDPLRELLRNASSQSEELADLYAEVSLALANTFEGRIGSPRTAELEAVIFKALLDHELQINPDDEWTFGDVGFDVLQRKMALLADQVADRHKQQVNMLIQRWGLQLLTFGEVNSVIPLGSGDWNQRVAELTEPRIRKFWFLLVAICRGLQTDDYYLSAEEAYWLGFIDEVIGRPDLTSPRDFAEYEPENDKTTGVGQ